MLRVNLCLLNVELNVNALFWLQSLLSRADAKVKELRQSISLLKAESEKLEVSFSVILFQLMI